MFIYETAKVIAFKKKQQIQCNFFVKICVCNDTRYEYVLQALYFYTKKMAGKV